MNVIFIVGFDNNSSIFKKYYSISSVTVNPYNAKAIIPQSQGRKDFWKPSKPCHVGIYLIALAEYTQMSTNVPGFQSFFSFFA